MKKINNWKCDACLKHITYIKNNLPFHKTHFDITRYRKKLKVMDGEIIDDPVHNNQKMLRLLCESCFEKILNESKTLGKLFFYKKGKCFLW